jgi:hypothetical protein
MVVELLRKECEFARSDRALFNTMEVLNQNSEFMKEGRGAQTSSENLESRRSLDKILQVFPIEGTYLLAFEAKGARASDTAEAANAAATTYCAMRRTVPVPSVHGYWKPEVEIADKAVPALRPERSPNPLAAALQSGLFFLVPFIVGAGLGYVGFLLEKGRRTKLAGLTARPVRTALPP